MAKHEVERLLGAASALDVKQNDVAMLLKKKQQDDDTNHKAHSTDTPAQDQAPASDAATASPESVQTPTELAAAEGVYAADASGYSSYGEFAAAESGGGLSTGAWVGIGVAAVGAGVLIYEATKSDDDDNGTHQPVSVNAVSPTVNEGGTATFEVHGNPGDEFSWTLTGVQAEDVQGGQLSGSVVIGQNGIGVVTINTVGDNVDEGDEVMTLHVGDQSANVTVVDQTAPQELVLTPDEDQIDLHDSAGADIVTGITDPAELLQNDESTYTNGDVVTGNGQTIVRLFVDSTSTGILGQPADVARLDDIATVEIRSQVGGGVLIIPGVSWDNVGEVNYNGGIGGLGVFVTSADAGLDMRLAGNVNGGTVGASYTTNLVGVVGNSGRGGASVTFGEDNLADFTASVTQSTNTAFVLIGGVRAGDVTVDDITVHGADNVTVNISDTTTFVGVGGGIAGNLTLGDIDVELGNTGTAFVTLTASADVNFGDMNYEFGNTGHLFVNVTAGADVNGGDIVAAFGDATVTSNSTVEFINVFGSGNVTLGNIDVEIGNVTATTTGGPQNVALVSISASTDVSVGDVTMSAGDYAISGSPSVSGTGYLFFNEAPALGGGGGNAVVNDISIDAGNNFYISAFVHMGTFSNNSGTDMTVGDVTMSVGDVVPTVANGPGPGSAGIGLFLWNTSALTGADLTVGNISLDAGVSATLSMDIFLNDNTSATGDLGTLHVGDVSIVMGENASGTAQISMTQNATTTTQGMGALEVGNIDLTVGQDATLAFTISQQLTGASGGAMGGLTVGDMHANVAGQATLSYNIVASNTASGDLGPVDIGDIVINADDGAFVSVSLLFNVTTGNSITSLSVGDIDIDVGVGATITGPSRTFSLLNAAPITFAGVGFTAVAAGIGDVSVGDVSVNLDQSAILNGTNNNPAGTGGLFFVIQATSGDVGTVTMGDVAIVLSDSAAQMGAYVADVEALGTADGDIGSVVFGDHLISLATSASYVVGDIMVVAAADDISSVTYGNLTVELGQSALFQGQVRAVASLGGDIGTVVVGDHNVHLASGASISQDVFLVQAAAGDIDSVTFGDFNITVTGTAATYAGVQAIQAAAAGGDVGDVVFGDVSIIGHTNANSVGQVDQIAALGNIDSVTLGDVNITLDATTTSNLGSAAFIMTVGANSIGQVDVGEVTLHKTAFVTAAVEAFQLFVNDTGTGTPDVNIGGLHLTDSSAGALTTEFAFIVAGSTAAQSISADVTIGIIDVNVTATNVTSYDLQGWGPAATGELLQGVNVNIANGSVSLGTVDYADYHLTNTALTTGATIDVSGFGGDTVVIGSSLNDLIYDNTGVNTLTGGDGSDMFFFSGGNTGLTQNAADVVTDFHHNEDVIVIGTTTAFSASSITAPTGVNDYHEGTYANFAAFMADVALIVGATGADHDDLIAGQIGDDVYVFVNGGGTADHTVGTGDFLVLLQGVEINDVNGPNTGLDFGDFQFNG